VSSRRRRKHGAQVGKLKRALIVAAYDGRCWICGDRPEELSLDHVIPRVDGGGLEVENHLRTLGIWSTPLPRFDRNGRLLWLDSGLRDSLSPDLHARYFPRRTDLQAVAA